MIPRRSEAGGGGEGGGLLPAGTAYGTFERFIPLPEGFEEAEIKAGYEDGVLEVIVPAAAKELEPPKPRTIPIETTPAVKATKVA